LSVRPQDGPVFRSTQMEERLLSLRPRDRRGPHRRNGRIGNEVVCGDALTRRGSDDATFVTRMEPTPGIATIRLLLYEEETDCELIRSVLAGEGFELDKALLSTPISIPAGGYAPCGARSTARNWNTCARLFTNCGGNWKTIRHPRSTCLPNLTSAIDFRK